MYKIISLKASYLYLIFLLCLTSCRHDVNTSTQVKIAISGISMSNTAKETVVSHKSRIDSVIEKKKIPLTKENYLEVCLTKNESPSISNTPISIPLQNGALCGVLICHGGQYIKKEIFRYDPSQPWAIEDLKAGETYEFIVYTNNDVGALLSCTDPKTRKENIKFEINIPDIKTVAAIANFEVTLKEGNNHLDAKLTPVTQFINFDLDFKGRYINFLSLKTHSYTANSYLYNDKIMVHTNLRKVSLLDKRYDNARNKISHSSAIYLPESHDFNNIFKAYLDFKLASSPNIINKELSFDLKGHKLKPGTIYNFKATLKQNSNEDFETDVEFGGNINQQWKPGGDIDGGDIGGDSEEEFKGSFGPIYHKAPGSYTSPILFSKAGPEYGSLATNGLVKLDGRLGHTIDTYRPAITNISNGNLTFNLKCKSPNNGGIIRKFTLGPGETQLKIDVDEIVYYGGSLGQSDHETCDGTMTNDTTGQIYNVNFKWRSIGSGYLTQDNYINTSITVNNAIK